MSEPKHTPGPRAVRHNENGTLGIDAKEPDGTYCQPARINGDLLKALERLLAYCGGTCRRSGPLHTVDSCSVCNARAAIAKAKGE